MARTTKDAPQWTAQNKPENWVGEHHNCTRFGIECDIDEPLTATARKYCFHDLADDHQRWYGRPPRGYRTVYYQAPERANARAQLGYLLREAQSGRYVDHDESLTAPHRHTPYGGGWWH
jgi:hypothetical protein